MRLRSKTAPTSGEQVAPFVPGPRRSHVGGVVAGSLRSPRMRHGVLFAPAVWAAPYLLLARTGIYKPMSEYDAQTLWKDFTAHLVYGAGLGWTFRLLSSRN